MELFEQLEERVTTLISKLESLTAENAALRAQAQASLMYEEENATLKEAIAEERRKNEAALARVDAILQRIKELPE